MPYQDGSSIVNFCIPAGSGMTGCNQAGKGWERQVKCSFSAECTSGGKCTHEKFGEYCGSHIAHRHRAGKPINLSDLNEKEALVKHESTHKKFMEDWKDRTDKELLTTAKIIKERKRQEFPGPIHTYRDKNGEVNNPILTNRQKVFDNKLVDQAVERHMGINGHFHNHTMPAHNHGQPGENLGFYDYYDEECHEKMIPEPHNHNLHENWPYKNGNEAVQMERYLLSRARVNQRTIVERYEVGLIVFIPSMYMLYDKEYHVYYSTEGVLKVSKSEQHLLTDFNDWKIHIPVNSVPTPCTDFGWHVTAVANKLFPNMPKVKWPVDRRFPKKSVCNDCARGWKYCKNQCSKYLLS